MEDRILEKLKLKIAISEIREESEIAMKKRFFINKKIAIAACACIVLTTGVVFAKDIEGFIRYYFGLNETVNKAAEEGYVEEVNSNVIEENTVLEEQEKGIVIDDINVALTFDEFVMDDLHLTTNMTFEFDEKIKEVFDLDKLQFISIRDLIVIDEENRIVFSNAAKPDFDKLKAKYNLSQNFGEYGEDYYNCPHGVSLLGHDKENNIIKYNIDASSADRFFPKSKELTFIFTKIKLEKYEDYTGQDIENGEYLKSNSITLTGDWNFKLEVPEKMYGRENIEYKIVSVSDPDVEVYLSSASETGFEFGAIVSNVVEPPFPEWEYLNEIEEQKNNGEITEQEYIDKYNAYAQTEEFANVFHAYIEEREIIKRSNWIEDANGKMTNEKRSCVENARGKRFYSAFLMAKNDFIEGNKYDFLDIYEMTKSDLTDKLSVILYTKDKEIKIELERIK